LAQVRNEAIALQHYARLAADTYAEQRAAEIRYRAERRAGELLTKMPKDKGGQPSKKNPRPKNGSTLKELGISSEHASQWQRMAAMPKPEFEASMCQDWFGETIYEFRLASTAC